ncbi:MAG: hypothetical protein QNK15_11790 [Cycloclasticus sp.]|nr:hypothetical protein [Cycloclasticus sp.]
MTEGGEERPINRIIFNKWALFGLALLIIIALAWSEYTWRPSNTDNLNISDSNVVCQQKKDREWYRITLTTPSNIELFLGGSYRIKECEDLKSEIIAKASNAQVLKPNGLILKIEGTESTLYQAEKPLFATVWFAFFVWGVILAIIERVQRKKT